MLGPLEVLDDGGVVPLGGAKQRAVLAILLLHRNEVVSRERLIDGLWGDSPPASAAHTLETYMSRLRKALHRDGDRSRLLARSPGYRLQVDDGQLDLQRLEALMERGRQALVSGDPQTASDAFREGLALFRGAPLEDLTYAPFAQEEVRRLEDLRLAALEKRIDADLAIGRHLELVGELETLVARQPLRERFWAQLMLALYRSGRQGEALAAFDRARHGLADELGVDPGVPLRQLHEEILRQDATLDSAHGAIAVDLGVPEVPQEQERIPAEAPRGPPGGTPPRRPTRHRGRTAALLLAVAVVVALVAVRMPAVLENEGITAPTGVSPGLALIDAHTGDQIASVSRSEVALPCATGYSEGHFWVGNCEPESIVELEPRTGRILNQFAPPHDASGAYVIAGHTLWAAEDQGSDVVKVDVRFGKELDRVNLDGLVGDGRGGPGSGRGMALGAGSLWVGRDVGTGEVVRLNPDTLQVQHVYRNLGGGYINIAYGDGVIWTADNAGMRRIDPRTNTVTRVPLPGVWAVAAGGGFGWSSDSSKGVVDKVDQSGRVVASYDTGLGANEMSFSDGTLWVSDADVGIVTGIDAVTGQLTTFRAGHPVGAVAAGDGVVLVVVLPGRSFEDTINALTGKVARLFVQDSSIPWDDPALDSSPAAFQIEYATCAKLLNTPDQAQQPGWQLRPEVAAAMPTLSGDGRTYTFRIRPGYRFSPPSNQPVTAETFRFSIERALSPKLGEGTPGPRFIDDIRGEQAFRAGTTKHISGLRASGNTLTIALTGPSATFLQRLSLPFFCPVPTDSPVIPGGPLRNGTPVGGGTDPSAGPYYVADHWNDEYVILKRNPNYNGPRPQALDAIALREDIDAGLSLRRIQAGTWDGIVNESNPLLDPGGAVARNWGPGSRAAASGGQEWFAVPYPGVDALAFNASRPPFSDPTIRRAATLALNRADLVGATTAPEVPSAQLLPPNQPGYRSSQDPYPRGSSDLERAKELMRGRRVSASLVVASNCESCRQWAETVREQLAVIGIAIHIDAVADPQGAIRAPGARFELFEVTTFQDLSDPVAFLGGLLEGVPSSWLPPSVRGDLAALTPMTGPQRIAAAGDLAWRLAIDQVPAAAFAYQVNGQFFSPRLGCRLFPPFGYGVDLAALCLHSP
ncbi:MAG TPA: BTAD domain-containing putative transcriptional regulator [Actinomycetota bacterium]|nr:BTAD domain-containing putative transcriptional regulator [Actinomycetota bacterium]